MPLDTILMGLVILAGFYMAWNIGANDVANAMGTSVGSGALTLRQAVFVAAILEFSGAFFFGSHVSETIQTGIVDVQTFASQPHLLVFGMLASLIAAGVWLQIASYYGWPVSTTHTIVGAVVGFGVVAGGIDAVHWGNVGFIVSSWVLSPLLGGIFSFLIFTFLRKTIFYSTNPLEATKKITPFIVFVVVLILTLVLILSGLKNMHLELPLWQSALLSVAVGLIGAYFSKYLVKNITVNTDPQTSHSTPDLEAIASIDKAKRYLLQARPAFSGEMQYRLTDILDEVDTFKHSLKKTENLDAVHSEYSTVERIFGYLQIMTACLMAFAHGANDVANAIGPLAAAVGVLQTGVVSNSSIIPTWTLALGGIGIVVGLATWGWRVIETIGKKITELTPTRGFAAEFGASTTIVLASCFGMPISTTHTLVGSVLGVGLGRGIEALNLTMTRDIFISWLVTVPAGTAITVAFYYLFKFIFI